METSRLLGGLLLGAMMIAASPALADIPPRDACAELGESCSTAGTNADEPGTCKTAECTKATPQGSMTYECKRCVAASQGGGGEGGGAAGGGAAGEAGETPAQGGSQPDPTGGRSSTGGAAPSSGGAKASGGAANPTGGVSSTTGGVDGNAGSSGGANPGNGGKDDDGGCSIGNVSRERGLGGVMFALGLAGLLAARRRR